MKRSSMLFGALIFVASFLKGQSPGVVRTLQSYGPGFQSTHVGGASFHPTTWLNEYVFQTFTSGYLVSNYGDAYQLYVAPLSLPAGAEIHGLCVYAHDQNPDSDIRLQLKATRLVPGGISPGVVEISDIIHSSWDFGAGVVCADVVPPYIYTEVSQGEDGVFLSYYFEVFLYPLTGIGGVKVIWRSTVTPPPPTASFGDVPTSHPFFQFVEALAASGVTAGCGGGNFCPNLAVTRGQMAVFLAKALGLHWPG
jgi:hypothetical protein